MPRKEITIKITIILSIAICILAYLFIFIILAASQIPAEYTIDFNINLDNNTREVVNLFNETENRNYEKLNGELELYKESLFYTLKNLDECRDIQIDCIQNCFGEIPKKNRRN